MKPPAFEYYCPETLDEALGLLAQYGAEAKVLAGGQSLMPMLNMRLSHPGVVIDINRLPDLDRVTVEGTSLRVGALVRHAELEHSALAATHCPILPAAERLVAHLAIRQRGTVVGSVVHADPAAELPLVWLTLGGELEVRSTRGSRTIAPEAFYLGYFMTDLSPDELAVAVRFERPAAGHGWAIEEFARRAGDFALCAAAAVVEWDATRGVVQRVRLGLGGVGGAPVRLDEAVAPLVGAVPEAALVREVAHRVGQYLDPPDDLHASRAFRLHLAEVLSERALRAATRRAQAKEVQGA